MPKILLGKLSLGLIIVMPLLFFIGASFRNSLYVSVPAGKSILEDISKRPALALTILSAMASGILAFITGLVAVIRKKERSFLVYTAIVIGALLIVFLTGEFLSPH